MTEAFHIRGAQWLIDKFGALRPEGRRFESHSSRQVGPGQVLHSQLPVALLRVNSDTVSTL